MTSARIGSLHLQILRDFHLGDPFPAKEMLLHATRAMDVDPLNGALCFHYQVRMHLCVISGMQGHRRHKWTRRMGLCQRCKAFRKGLTCEGSHLTAMTTLSGLQMIVLGCSLSMPLQIPPGLIVPSPCLAHLIEELKTLGQQVAGMH